MVDVCLPRQRLWYEPSVAIKKKLINSINLFGFIYGLLKKHKGCGNKQLNLHLLPVPKGYKLQNTKP